MRRFILLFLLVNSLIIFLYAQDNRLFMERIIPRKGFIQLERAAPDHVHEVVFAIKKKNMNVIKETALERATPGSPNYQKWLSYDEVTEIVQNEEGYQAVMDWLKQFSDISISHITRRKDYIRASAQVSTWEEALNTTFYKYEDETYKNAGKSQKFYYRCEEYSVPENLDSHLKAVFNTAQAPPAYRKKYHRLQGNEEMPFKTSIHLRRRATDGKNQRFSLQSSGRVTVAFLDSYYRISSNLANPILNQSVFETNDEYMSSNDLTQFQETYELTVQAAEDKNGHIAESCTSDMDCTEGNLDIQYIMGVAQQAGSIYWWVSSDDTDPFVAWITEVANDPYPPSSNSISWGATEQVSSIKINILYSLSYIYIYID